MHCILCSTSSHCMSAVSHCINSDSDSDMLVHLCFHIRLGDVHVRRHLQAFSCCFVHSHSKMHQKLLPVPVLSAYFNFLHPVSYYTDRLLWVQKLGIFGHFGSQICHVSKWWKVTTDNHVLCWWHTLQKPAPETGVRNWRRFPAPVFHASCKISGARNQHGRIKSNQTFYLAIRPTQVK